MKNIFSVLLLGSALAFPIACDKKDEAKKEDTKGKADAKGKADEKAKADDKKAAPEEKKADAPEEKKAEDTKAADAGGGDAASTGAPECDELIKKTRCMYEKTPGTPDAAKKAFDESIKAWTDALKNDATKAATVSACKASLDGGKAGFDAVGC